jgi:hypothetical protein
MKRCSDSHTHDHHSSPVLLGSTGYLDIFQTFGYVMPRRVQLANRSTVPLEGINFIKIVRYGEGLTWQ